MGDLTPKWVKSRVWSRTCSYMILSTDNKVAASAVTMDHPLRACLLNSQSQVCNSEDPNEQTISNMVYTVMSLRLRHLFSTKG